MNLKIKKILDFWLGGFLVVLLYFPVRIAGQFLRRSHDLSSPQHIALVKLLGGGSLFMAYPLIQALKKKIPGLKISVVCSKQVAPFAQVMDVFDEIRVLDDRHFGTLLRSSIDHILWLARNVDITVDLEIYSRLTTIFTTVSLVKNRIGLINTQSFWRRRIYSHAIFVNSQHGIFYYYDGIANLFGIKSINIIEAQDHFLEHIQKTKNAQQELQDVKYFTFGVGCSDLAFERMLPEKNWISLSQQILQQQLTEKIVFIGGKADAILAERMIAELPAGRGLNLCGQLDLMGSLAVLLKSQCFLGIDSALIHFARFLRKNVEDFGDRPAPNLFCGP